MFYWKERLLFIEKKKLNCNLAFHCVVKIHENNLQAAEPKIQTFTLIYFLYKQQGTCQQFNVYPV